MKEGELVDFAHRIAQRSPVRRFQTGAVIYKNGSVISTGWSHASSLNMACYRSMHAEMHALSRCDVGDTVGSTIAVVTLSRKSGNRTDGTPCLFCLRNIQKYGIETIICTTSGGGQKTLYLEDIDISKISRSVDVNAKKVYISSMLQPAC